MPCVRVYSLRWLVMSLLPNPLRACWRQVFAWREPGVPGSAQWISELNDIEVVAYTLGRVLAQVPHDGKPRILSKWEKELTAHSL